MNIYENVVILDPSLTEEDIKGAVSKISDVITTNGGEILEVESWGKKKLAYEINKHKFGFYTIFLFKSPSSLIKKIEDYFKVFDPVIKFMVVKLDKRHVAALSKEPSDMPTETEKKEQQNV